MSSIHRLLRQLIALPSVNPAFLPPGHSNAGEGRVVEFLASTARKSGLDVESQEVSSGRANLLARMRPKGKARQKVLLAPHLDTVNAIPAQFRPKQRNGHLFGRGACDTKGSVAVMMDTLCRLAKAGCRPAETEVIFVGLVDEENAQAGSRHLASTGFQADLAIVGEPTRARVVTAHKGSIWLEIRTHGRAAHGAQPEAGINAVHTMARIVEFLETEYGKVLKKRTNPLLGNPTSSVGTICGGTQPNIVPDQCAIWVDRRTLPGETDESVCREIKKQLGQRGLKAEIFSRRQGQCPPLNTDPNLPLVKTLLKSARQSRTLGVRYFCDAAILSLVGIPSVVFGPGDIAQAHTSDEWVSMDSVDRAAAILERFLRSLP